MLIIGLTGGIGSGKSTVSRCFEQLGIAVVDTDVIAREVVAKDSLSLGAITAHFGADILTPEGELDRRKLREIIFSQPAEKLWLERLLHPVIREHTRAQLAQVTSAYAILSSPLLIESPDVALVHGIIVVDVPESEQTRRVMRRDGVSQSQIEKTLLSQIDRASRLKKADYIIDNSGSIANTEAQVATLHQQLLNRAKAQNNGN